MTPDTLYRRLTVANTLAWCFLLLGVIVIAIAFRDQAVNIVHGYLQKETITSRFVEMFKTEEIVSSSEIPIPLFQLRIKPSDLREIHILSQSLIEQGVMLDKDKRWFSAKFTHEGEEYKVKVRLRGDFNPHWAKAKKSWRIKFEKRNPFNGYREINLVVPADRQYELEHVAFTLARQSGLLEPDSGFAHVQINGIDMGGYFWFEHNTPEMLEKNRFPEGEIIRSNNMVSRQALSVHGLALSDFYYVLGSYTTTIRRDATAGYALERFGELLDLVRHAEDETLRRRLPYYVDMEKFLRWNALASMFGSKHAGGLDNLRWYYDTTRGVFEPILYDVGMAELGKDTFLDDYFSPIVDRILQIPQHRHRRNEILWSFLNDEEFNPVPKLKQVFASVKPYFMRGVNSPLGNALQVQHDERVRVLEHNRQYLRSALATADVYADSRLLKVNNNPLLSFRMVPDSESIIRLERLRLTFSAGSRADPALGRITLTNDSGQIVDVNGARLFSEANGLGIQFQELTFWNRRKEGAHNLLPTTWTLDIELPGVNLRDWQTPGGLTEIGYEFSNAVSGQPIAEARIEHPTPALGYDAALTNAPFRPVHAFIEGSELPFRVENGSLVLDRGVHEIRHTLLLPVDYGLLLNAGAVLRIAPEVSIVTYRALKVLGTEQDPVVVEPLVSGKPWGVLAVIDANEASEIDHLHLGGGSEAWINGIYISGQLSLYESDLRLRDSVITDAKADDGLNVKKARVRIEGTRFANNSADGFDGDWINGIVTGSVFVDNGGDGIDTSGAELTVSHSLFSGMGDKALSIGEKSTLHSFNNVIRDSLIGVASKDLSTVYVYANVFYQNQTGMALYQKKPIFGPGRAEVLSSLFWANNENFSLDEGSSLRAIGIGVDKWTENPRVEVTDLRQGAVAQFYEVKDQAGISYSSAAGGHSPFDRGPKTEPTIIDELALPDFSQAAIGLVKPLTVQP